METLAGITFYFSVMCATFWIITQTENKLRVRNHERPCEVYDRRSLKVFKALRLISSLAVSAEITLFRSQNDFYLKSLFCLVLILSGLTLRILAIRSLGQFWSFHVVRYADQPLIKSGIYRHISQPAYLGNIYLVGIYLAVGALLTTAITAVWLIAFGAYRIQVERAHKLCL